ncbi:MAG: hypothetical protein P4N41_11440 [Negativicutes bacterium]|nr:hypothetical protein [Negativicutes bacterium]
MIRSWHAAGKTPGAAGLFSFVISTQGYVWKKAGRQGEDTGRPAKNIIGNETNYKQVKAVDDEERVTPVQPVQGLRVEGLRVFGAEERPPRRGPAAKKAGTRQPPAADLPCTVTPDKVDCKI